MINIEDYQTVKIDLRRLYEENKTEESPCYETFRSRFRYGWNLEEALYKTPSESLSDNQEYLQWKQTAIQNGISEDTFRSRIFYGVRRGTMTFEEAATRPTEKRGAPKKRDYEQIIINKLSDKDFGYITLTKKEKQYVKEHPGQFKEWL